MWFVGRAVAPLFDSLVIKPPDFYRDCIVTGYDIVVCLLENNIAIVNRLQRFYHYAKLKLS